MKQNFKIFFIALILGLVASYIYCTNFEDHLTIFAKEETLTYFYVGSYNNLEAATNKKNNYKNAVIYNDNGVYKVIIGSYTKPESISLMRTFFADQGITFWTNELKIKNEYKNKASSYELLIKSSDKTYYDNINNSLLKLFDEYLN